MFYHYLGLLLELEICPFSTVEEIRRLGEAYFSQERAREAKEKQKDQEQPEKEQLPKQEQKHPLSR